eukprot:CAMPEP_0115144180 /NCGR_PEP_ID=MMETSP0227-20121206/61282_1 /TAXON_ID=89957 /ORGANISM="Polarella glacialis, Strain CCMP 1383" /LENGTH=212 /DNA_ID=CAMNT_0002553289 /DNA_START=245 /DNA_END=880 /DNA_ORIENTATION=-
MESNLPNALSGNGQVPHMPELLGGQLAQVRLHGDRHGVRTPSLVARRRDRRAASSNWPDLRSITVLGLRQIHANGATPNVGQRNHRDTLSLYVLLVERRVLELVAQLSKLLLRHTPLKVKPCEFVEEGLLAEELLQSGPPRLRCPQQDEHSLQDIVHDRRWPAAFYQVLQALRVQHEAVHLMVSRHSSSSACSSSATSGTGCATCGTAASSL